MVAFTRITVYQMDTIDLDFEPRHKLYFFGHPHNNVVDSRRRSAGTGESFASERGLRADRRAQLAASS